MEADRDQLEAAIVEFLGNGGRIQQLANGEVAVPLKTIKVEADDPRRYTTRPHERIRRYEV